MSNPLTGPEEIAICYAGKVAEEIVFGGPTREYYLDIQRTIKLVRAYLNEGFSNIWISIDELSTIFREGMVKSLQNRWMCAHCHY